MPNPPDPFAAGAKGELPVFCLQCFSTKCAHLEYFHQVRTLPTGWFTPREMETLKALITPNPPTFKQKAGRMGITHGTFKQYVVKIYRKLQWSKPECCPYRLTLWVAAHHEALGFDLPKSADFLPHTE